MQLPQPAGEPKLMDSPGAEGAPAEAAGESNPDGGQRCGAPPRAPRWWRPGLVALGLLAGVIAVGCSALVFPYMTTNSDEGTYLTQAETLVHGHLVTPAPKEAQSAFRPWLMAPRSGSFVSKFTPAHAGILAVSDAAFGSPVPALAGIAAADLILLALLVTALGGSHRAGLGAGLLLALSPAWLIQSGTYLPYLSSVALLLAAAVCLARGVTAGRPGWWALAGAAWGAAFFGRQYDAALMLVPLALIALRVKRIHRSSAPRSLMAMSAAFAAGAAPFIVLLGAYDHAATGAVTRLPFTLLERSDTVGFGKHRVQRPDHYLDYTPKAAIHATVLNTLDVLRSVAGGAVLVGVAGYGLLRDRRLPGRLVYLGIAAIWMAGYFLFWGSYAVTVLSDINTYLGAIYYLPAIIAVVAAGAVTLDRLARRRPGWTGVLVAAIVVTSVALAVPLLANNLRRTEVRRAVAAEVNRHVPGGHRSLLLVNPAQGPFVGHPVSWLRNPPDYRADRLVAVHDPVTDFTLIDHRGDRTAYFVSLVNQKPVPAVRARVEPVRVFRAPTVALRVTGPPPEPGWHRAVSVGRGPKGERSWPVATATVVVEVTVGPTGMALSGDPGSPLSQRMTPRPATAVTIRFRDSDGQGKVRTSERRIPVRASGGGTEVLVPGLLVADGLRGPLAVSASAGADR